MRLCANPQFGPTYAWIILLPSLAALLEPVGQSVLKTCVKLLHLFQGCSQDSNYELVWSDRSTFSVYWT